MAPRWQHRHERSWYFAQKLQDTITGRICRVFCSIFVSILLLTALILFILWLSLRPHRPRFHVLDFSLAPPPSSQLENGTATQPSAATVHFNVSLRNPNQNIGIFYDDALQGFLYFREARVGITAPLLPVFYQPPKNTTVASGDISGTALRVDADAWEQMRGEARASGEVWFRLELVATIRFRVSVWDTHRHSMHVDCDVGVAPDGTILPKARDRRCHLYFG